MNRAARIRLQASIPAVEHTYSRHDCSVVDWDAGGGRLRRRYPLSLEPRALSATCIDGEAGNGPYRTFTVEYPTGDTNQLQISDSNSGSIYNYSWRTNGWLLASGGGLRNELKTSALSATNTITTITNTVSGASGPAVQSKVEVWKSSATTSNLITEIFGSGSASRTNSYTYTTNGYLQQFVRWDGYWEYYVYDNNNRATNRFSAFLNQGVTTDRTLCRFIEYSYSSNSIPGAGDNIRFFFNTPRRTIESIKGTEVNRKYFIGTNGMKQ
jgi:hypothetical protein